MKLWKTQLNKIRQSGGYLCRLLEPLLKVGLPFMKFAFKPLTKSFLKPLGLIAKTSAIDAVIHKKMSGSGTKIKVGTYLINFDEFKSIGTHWVASCVNGNNGSASYNAIYFDSFRVKHFKKKSKDS